MKFQFKLLGVFYGSVITTLALEISPTLASPNFPISNIVFHQGHEEGVLNAEFTVPDGNTKVFIKGSKLRRYDAHVAKMFELTDYECRSDTKRKWDTIIWQYLAGNGDINMGLFNISCNQARSIAKNFGLSKAKRTKFLYHKATNVINVPALNISGANTSQWLKFVQTFPPYYIMPPILNDTNKTKY